MEPLPNTTIEDNVSWVFFMMLIPLYK
jgi:hypothetical protein